MQAFDGTLGAALRRRAAGRRGGKHPGADPRQPADGALQHARRAAAHDRQQVRAVGRLLHAVRRHVGRAGGDRGRAQDDGLSRGAWRNETAGRPQIPAATITKPPSAELRPDQTDQDSLPPYDVLDDILQRHVERHQTADEIVAAGFDADTVAARAAPGEARRVQAQAGSARIESHRSRVRHRLAHADRGAAHLAAQRAGHVQEIIRGFRDSQIANRSEPTSGGAAQPRRVETRMVRERRA